MVSDVRVTCQNDVIAQSGSKVLKSPIYRYVTTATPSSPVNKDVPFDTRLSFHFFDFMGFLGTFPSFMERPPTEKDMQYIKTMRNLISSFMKTGKPHVTAWKQYPKTVGLIDSKVQVATGYHTKECKFWMDKGFFGYGWRN